MVVQHNLTAMNSNRMLNMTSKIQSKSTEKLSSGYKINRAADDAAGLSISEKMRKKIRGLTQASANAQDGISAVQTAEGALNEVQDMLQRMNELAVKSANGTNSSDDRTYIQNEIDQLATEIDRVAETTKFNETYLLKGDKDNPVWDFKYGNPPKITGGFNSMSYDPTKANVSSKALGSDVSAADLNAFLVEIGKSGIDITQTSGAITSVKVGVYTADISGTSASFKTSSGTEIMKMTMATGTDGSSHISVSGITYAKEAGEGFYDKNGNALSANALRNYLEYQKVTDGNKLAHDSVKLRDGMKIYDAGGNEVNTFHIEPLSPEKDDIMAFRIAGPTTLKLHVGADATANNQISVDISAMTAEGIGVNNLKVDGADDKNALKAIETVKAAIQIISTQRSALGAVQNRLDHTISNLDNVVENTTNAESQIRDTDMATEMVKYSNNNILAQAGQAMLAQANQSNQGVLSLL